MMSFTSRKTRDKLTGGHQTKRSLIVALAVVVARRTKDIKVLDAVAGCAKLLKLQNVKMKLEES